MKMETVTALKATHGQSSRRLIKSWPSQLADKEFLTIMEKLHYI